MRLIDYRRVILNASNDLETFSNCARLNANYNQTARVREKVMCELNFGV